MQKVGVFYEVQMYQQIWKDIPTWEGIYQVSNFGRVKRLFKFKQHLLKTFKNKFGYYQVYLNFNERKQYWMLHRLVATVFQRPIQKGEDAHHKNHLPCCNCVQNIQIKDEFTHLSEHHKGKKLSKETIERYKRIAKRKARDPITGRFLKTTQ